MLLIFLKKKRIKDLNKNVFCTNNVFHPISYKILKSNNPYMLKNDSTRNKIRKKKKIITSNQIRRIEMILENESLDRKGLI